jgi:hypothetical protein
MGAFHPSSGRLDFAFAYAFSVSPTQILLCHISMPFVPLIFGILYVIIAVDAITFVIFARWF